MLLIDWKQGVKMQVIEQLHQQNISYYGTKMNKNSNKAKREIKKGL